MQMQFFASRCPLTGISNKGRVTTEALNGSSQVLYIFKPIGKAIFTFGAALAATQMMNQGSFKTRTDLAGLCRQAAEKGEAPLVFSEQALFGQPAPNIPVAFEEKQAYFLRLLYETGGREHKRRDIFIEDDFPMAFAEDAQEFSEIIDALIDEELLRYDKPNDSLNDWVGGIRTHYHGVLLTPAGKRRAKELADGVATKTEENQPKVSPPEPDSPLANLHPAVQQASSSRFASAHYSDAILAACTSLDKAVQAKANLPTNTVGTALMTTAFSAKSPLIQLSQDTNEQMGFMNLYQGSVQAIRNHYAHNLTGIPAPRALEWLGFISALFYKLDEATQHIPE